MYFGTNNSRSFESSVGEKDPFFSFPFTFLYCFFLFSVTLVVAIHYDSSILISILASVYFSPLILTALENRDMLAAKKTLEFVSKRNHHMIRSWAWREMTKDKSGKGQAEIKWRVKKRQRKHKISHTLPYTHTRTHTWVHTSKRQVNTPSASFLSAVGKKSPTLIINEARM